MQRLAFTIATILLFSTNFLLAQSTSNITNDILTPKGGELVVLEDDNWSFYIDEESKTYFIDFEQINFNLSDIIVKNEAGETIFKDDVLQLPVNTIYELDFNKYGAGKYQVELRSFTGMIRKNVQIK